MDSLQQVELVQIMENQPVLLSDRLKGAKLFDGLRTAAWKNVKKQVEEKGSMTSLKTIKPRWSTLKALVLEKRESNQALNPIEKKVSLALDKWADWEPDASSLTEKQKLYLLNIKSKERGVHASTSTATKSPRITTATSTSRMPASSSTTATSTSIIPPSSITTATSTSLESPSPLATATTSTTRSTSSQTDVSFLMPVVSASEDTVSNTCEDCNDGCQIQLNESISSQLKRYFTTSNPLESSMDNASCVTPMKKRREAPPPRFRPVYIDAENVNHAYGERVSLKRERGNGIRWAWKSWPNTSSDKATVMYG